MFYSRSRSGRDVGHNAFFDAPAGSQLPTWIIWWMKISSVLCAMDVFYTMMRPWTNRGGGGWLEKFYEPWNIYADVDFRYARWDDLVTMANGRVMLIEIVMNIISLRMNASGSKHTLMTTFTTTAFVFWKTVWYMTLFVHQPEGTEPMLNPEASALRIFWVFWVADGFWIVVPLFVMIALWPRMARVEGDEGRGRRTFSIDDYGYESLADDKEKSGRPSNFVPYI